MRILYIVNALIPGERANSIQVMQMCNAFADSGHEVVLVVPQRRCTIKIDPHTYYNTSKNIRIKKIFCIDTVNYGRIGLLVQETSFAFCAFVYTIFVDANVYYSRDVWWSFLASMIHKKFIIEIHDAPHKRRYVYARVFKKAQHIITTTKVKLDYIDQKFHVLRNKITVAPNGVDVEAFKKLPSRIILRNEFSFNQDDVIVGYVGKYTTFGVKKGVDELITAFARAHALQPHLHLLIVGIQESEKKGIKILLEKEKIISVTTLITHVPHPSAIRYMKACDILVMNYPNIEHYQLYMFPLKLCEYMASGATIISSDLQSVREVLSEDNAVLVPPDDITCLTKALARLASKSELRVMYAAQAFQDVQKYDWKKRANSVLLSLTP